MAPTNSRIADLLRQYATVLVLEGSDRFKVKAYRRAAETIEALDKSLAALVASGADLKMLPGIGKAISRSIEELLQSGKFTQLDRALSKLRPELVELATRPMLEPKTVMRIYKKLNISSVEELSQRLKSGEIREQFGSRVDFQIRRGLDARPRMLLYAAERIAQNIEAFLGGVPAVTYVSRTGSLRRKQVTVGDLNFLVGGKTSASVFRSFAKYSAVKSVKRYATNEKLFQLSSGINVRLAWAPASEMGFALLQHTGAPAHLEHITKYAKQKGITLSAQGLAAKRIDISAETTVYAGLGLPFIEPELREGRGEVEAAAKGKLPKLVCIADLKGDLHMHTTESDGANTLAEMVRAAQDRGYEYIAITNHSQSLKIANGLSEKGLMQQVKSIDKLNSRLKNFQVLKSAEVDILEDGSLDYSNRLLKELDFTICSIHSRFRLDIAQQTARIMKAMDNPYFTILGHATGRLLLKREGYEIDINRIISHAKENGCYFEINANPNRLDLSDEHAKLAKDAGVKIAINTDAHSIKELNFIAAGVNQARREWLERSDILNTLPMAKLRRLLPR
jgi:DNA polymerase (family 10)